MKLFTIFTYFLLSLFSMFTVLAQTKVSKKSNNELIYLLVGNGCPSCNKLHPELKYGFKVKCVGCIMTDSIETHNRKVVRKIDSIYGEGWMDKFISNYCVETRRNYVDKSGVNRCKNLKADSTSIE